MRTVVRHAWLSFLFVAAPCFGASPLPTFGTCPAAPQTVKKPAQVRLSTAESKRYATQLRSAAKQQMNFAGHYILATWGCGAGCVMAGAIDIQTGKVTMLPFTVSDWPLEVTEPLSYQKDSCLLIVRGSRNEEGHGTYFYKFNGSAFELSLSTEVRTK